MNIKKIALPLIAVMALSAVAVAHSKGFKPKPIPLPFPTRPTLPAPWPGSTARGPEVPFPLSATLPFPWSKIEGVWEARVGSQVLLFSFEKQFDTDGSQLLQVIQLDGVSGQIISDGVGISVPSDNLVRAAMAGSSVGNYMLYIGAYKNPNASLRAPKALTVLTIRPFDESDNGSDIQYVVSKLSNLPYQRSNPVSQTCVK